MTKKARKGILPSEVEGEVCMEDTSDNTKDQKINTTKEQLNERSNIGSSDDGDGAMTANNNRKKIGTEDMEAEEQVMESGIGKLEIEGEHLDVTSGKGKLSSSDSSLDNNSETSDEVVCTGVQQGRSFDIPDGFEVDERGVKVEVDEREVEAIEETTPILVEDEGGRNLLTTDRAVINANYLKEAGRHREEEDQKLAKGWTAIPMLPTTRADVRAIKWDPHNTLSKRYRNGDVTFQSYRKEERWDPSSEEASGGRSFETDVKRFLRSLASSNEEDITQEAMMDKVKELGSTTEGVLRSTPEGIWARSFIGDTSVSHPMELFHESWTSKDRMENNEATRLFWTISQFLGNHWALRSSTYAAAMNKPTPAIRTGAKGAAGAGRKAQTSVKLDDGLLKKLLRQVKVKGEKRKHVKYYALTLTIPPTPHPATKFDEIASELLQNLYAIDDTIIIYPYKIKNHEKKPAVKGLDAIPKSTGVWNAYFERMYPLKAEGSKIYTGMLIGHNEEPEEIIDGIKWWTMSNEHFFKEKAVQAERVVDCVWMAYSPANWDPVSLQDWLEKRFDYQHQFGCRDKRINSGNAYNPKERAPFAMHIEVSEDQLGVIFKKLKTLVSLKAKRQDMPLMIEMRAVPDLKNLKFGKFGIYSDSMVSNCKAMATKQGTFRQTSGQMTTWAFTNPDFVPPDKTKSLRMWIFTLKHEGEPLFHGLTPENRGTGQIFTFNKRYEDVARMMIMGLYVYIEHMDPGQGRYWFNAETVELAEGAYWDAEKGVIVSPDDQALADAVAESWWKTDDLVNDHGEDPVVPTRPDKGPAITADDNMMDHKFDDGKTVGSAGIQLFNRATIATIPDSISETTLASENEQLKERLMKLEALLVVSSSSSQEPPMQPHLQAENDKPGYVVTPVKATTMGLNQARDGEMPTRRNNDVDVEEAESTVNTPHSTTNTDIASSGVGRAP